MPTFAKENTSALYLHVPKTGGTYVEQLMLANGFLMYHWSSRRTIGAIKRAERAPLQHMHREMILSLFEPSSFSFVFMTVREPISRLVSEFRMRNPLEKDPRAAKKWMLNSLKSCRSDRFLHENHIRPQVDFLIDGSSVFRQEDGFGESFVNSLETGTATTFQSRSTKRHMEAKSTLSEAEIRSGMKRSDLEFVADFYKEDYEVFGYKWPV